MTEPLDRLVGPLSALMRWFEETGIRAAVIGGVAVSLRGKLSSVLEMPEIHENLEKLLATRRRW